MNQLLNTSINLGSVSVLVAALLALWMVFKLFADVRNSKNITRDLQNKVENLCFISETHSKNFVTLTEKFRIFLLKDPKITKLLCVLGNDTEYQHRTEKRCTDIVGSDVLEACVADNLVEKHAKKNLYNITTKGYTRLAAHLCQACKTSAIEAGGLTPDRVVSNYTHNLNELTPTQLSVLVMHGYASWDGTTSTSAAAPENMATGINRPQFPLIPLNCSLTRKGVEARNKATRNARNDAEYRLRTNRR